MIALKAFQDIVNGAPHETAGLSPTMIEWKLNCMVEKETRLGGIAWLFDGSILEGWLVVLLSCFIIADSSCLAPRLIVEAFIIFVMLSGHGIRRVRVDQKQPASVSYTLEIRYLWFFPRYVTDTSRFRRILLRCQRRRPSPQCLRLMKISPNDSFADLTHCHTI